MVRGGRVRRVVRRSAGLWTGRTGDRSQPELLDGLAGGERRRGKAGVVEQVAVAGDDHLGVAGGGQHQQIVVV